MPAERYYFKGELPLHQSISLKEGEFHHLTRVMRTHIGDFVEVINGEGSLAQAEVLQIEKKEAILFIRELSFEPKDNFEIILAQAIPRPNRLDFILEKGTKWG